MSAPWPPEIEESFFRATRPDRISHELSAFNGPYNRLLCHLFTSAPFEVVPPWRLPESSPYISEDVYQSPFTIEVKSHPVFFIDVQPASFIKADSSRRKADARMRGYFQDFRERVVTPYLHGVSAFGSRLCFYTYTLATNTLEPAPVPAVLNDLTPATQWDCDLLDADGAARLREVVESVFQMGRTLKQDQYLEIQGCTQRGCLKPSVLVMSIPVVASL